MVLDTRPEAHSRSRVGDLDGSRVKPHIYVPLCAREWSLAFDTSCSALSRFVYGWLVVLEVRHMFREGVSVSFRTLFLV